MRAPSDGDCVPHAEEARPRGRGWPVGPRGVLARSPALCWPLPPRLSTPKHTVRRGCPEFAEGAPRKMRSLALSTGFRGEDSSSPSHTSRTNALLWKPHVGGAGSKSTARGAPQLRCRIFKN